MKPEVTTFAAITLPKGTLPGGTLRGGGPTVETLEARIGRVAGLLDALQRARRSALADERTGWLLAIRADFEAGLPRTALLARHGCTRGQLAAWSRRFAWRRPPPTRLVKMLQGHQRAAYRRGRLSGLPHPEALELAMELVLAPEAARP